MVNRYSHLLGIFCVVETIIVNPDLPKHVNPTALRLVGTEGDHWLSRSSLKLEIVIKACKRVSYEIVALIHMDSVDLI